MNLIRQYLTNNDCYWVGQRITPKGVMVHSTGANNPRLSRYVPGNAEIGYNWNGNDWDRSGLDACVHAFIGKLSNGSVGTVQTLPWNMRGWHCDGTGNNTHISFEICEDDLTDATYFSSVYQEAVELTAWLCKMYGFNPMADGVVICHSEGNSRGIASNHADVMHWFPRHGKTMDDFRADVARAIEGEVDMTKDEVKQLIRDTVAEIDAERAAQGASEWAEPYIKQGVELGLTADVGNGKMARPQDKISREEAVTMCVAAVKAARKE